MDKIKLIEIKLNEQGEKCTAILKIGVEQFEVEVYEVIKKIQTGTNIIGAKVENDELFYIPTGKKPLDLKGQPFTAWTAKEYLGNKMWKCECSCGKIRAVNNFSLLYTKSTSCGHLKLAIEDLTDRTFGEWYVQSYAGNNLWNCVCSCTAKKQVRGDRLKQGLSTSCGHASNEFIDIKDKTFNDWTALEYVGYGYWKCRCSCGTIKDVLGLNLRNGSSKSCGHSTIDLSGQTINEWFVLRKLDDRQYECQCSCGKIRNVYDTNLTQGISKSCGQCNRTEEQIEIIRSKKKFQALLLREYIKLKRPLLISEVSIILAITSSYASHLVTKYEAEAYVNVLQNRSELEEQVALFIESLGIEVDRCNRTAIKGIELDIYIDSHKLAIEVNGSYWHSTLKKDKNYHFKKTQTCIENNINLIHIFEHEWKNTKVQEKIKELIKKRLGINQTKIYARNTIVRNISTSVAADFINNYHLQGTVGCEEALGLFYNDKLVEVMTFGIPRYSTEHDKELIRLCSTPGYEVVGGASKLFKHYIETYKPRSVVSYCDISKFNGNVYEQLGFEFDGYTPPNYVYVNSSTLSTLSRYQCMKHKLIEKGWGTEDQTEEQIMTAKGYMKVYDCGNKRYVYRSTC